MAIPYEKLVKEDLNLGYGTVDVTMPAGGTATGTKIGLHTFTEVFNVKDFGALGDGLTNDSAAFTAAIAAVPDTGGTVFVPPGTYKINLLINRRKIRLVGTHVGRVNSTTNAAGLTAYDPTLPVVTISNDTQLNEGVELRDLEFSGFNTCYYALKLAGGSYSQFFNNITIQGFTKKGLWILSGAAQPCAFLYFNGLGIQPFSSAAHEHNILIEQGASATYVEAIFFNNVRNSGVPYGYALELAGSSNTVWTNSWFQVTNGHGVRLTQPFSTTPRLNGNGLYIDSDTGSDTLVSVGFGPGVTDVIGNYVYGFVGIDGKVDLNGTLRLNESVMHLPFATQIVYPYLMGSAYFTDPAGPTSTTLRIAGETVAGRLDLIAPNQVLVLSGIGEFRNDASAVGAIGINTIINNAGTHTWRATGLNTEIQPPVGGVTVLKSPLVAFGTLTGPRVDSTNDLFQFNRNTSLSNNQSYSQLAADGVTQLSVGSYNGSNNLFLGQGVTGSFTTVQGVTNVKAAIGGVTKLDLQAAIFQPNIDNDLDLGGSTHRWKTVYAVAGAINTSDEREKQDILPIDDTVLDAWAEVAFVQYRWREAVAKKGESARIHHGVIAQRVVEVFAAKQLDATRYGLLCHDAWAEHQVLDGHDEVDEPYDVPDPDNPTGLIRKTRRVLKERYRTVPAGDRYGVRADQCLFLEAALQRRTTTRLQARLDALEAKG